MSEAQAQWARHLEAIEAEGLSTQAYAQREGLSAASLYSWRRRLKSMQQRAALETVPRLVAVQMPERAEPMRCTLLVTPGVRLELVQLPPAAWLAQLAGAVAQQVR
ncbi:hypothetical protein CDO46_10960 [Pigmentiphaga sp. NML030171]|jgi:hypothetical protein|uniref:IS66 family insertion sequence element accessory protein TnpA n=1 Tax=Pigmentiphaga sp. NML030171 TaxID=2008676 RepID=UPI000B41A024|nr:cobyrinic acid ac-diamide synthase [Pigmentiphaga sp. NML030171]OVZ63775.1 hypothetical protein CDO46_10960 [Pigmentiphaga sp. NML030171]